MIILGFRRKIIPVEYQDDKNTHSDGGVRQIEDRGKERGRFTAHQRQPFRPREGEERELQHIHYPTTEQRSVPSSFGHEFGHLSHTRIEAVAIEDAIDDVTRRTRYDGGDTEHKATFHPLPDHMTEVIAKRTHSDDPQYGQDYLVVPLEELHTKGDSVILLESDEKPTCHLDALMQVEVRLHVQLHNLIDQYDTEDQSGSVNPFLFLF